MLRYICWSGAVYWGTLEFVLIYPASSNATTGLSAEPHPSYLPCNKSRASYVYIAGDYCLLCPSALYYSSIVLSSNTDLPQGVICEHQQLGWIMEMLSPAGDLRHSQKNKSILCLIWMCVCPLTASPLSLPEVWPIRRWSSGSHRDWGVLQGAAAAARAGRRVQTLFKQRLRALHRGAPWLPGRPGRGRLAESRSESHTHLWAQRLGWVLKQLFKGFKAIIHHTLCQHCERPELVMFF